MEYYAIVILYNKRIEESLTITHLMMMSNEKIHIIILDNSNQEYVLQNQKYPQNQHFQYHCMNRNVGLSRAYNYALWLLSDKNKNDIVIWFDDDTPVSEEYFKILQEKAENIKYDVFAPIIYGQDGVIYSPNEIGLLKGRYLKTPNQKIHIEKFNAINSCLAVRLHVYRNYTYDEKLFMDCVDTKLFDDFRKMKVSFCVLPIEIHQNFFQRSDNMDVEKYWNRFRIRIKDTINYSYMGGFVKRASGIIRVLGWAVVYGIKLKSVVFFGKCIRWMLKLISSDNNITRKEK